MSGEEASLLLFSFWCMVVLLQRQKAAFQSGKRRMVHDRIAS